MNFEKYFECDLIKLKDQHISKILNINIIKKQKTKYGDTYLIYDKENNFKYFSNTQLKSYLDKVCESPSYVQFYDYIIKNEKLSCIFNFEIESMVNKYDNIIVKLKILKNKTPINNDIDNIDK